MLMQLGDDDRAFADLVPAAQLLGAEAAQRARLTMPKPRGEAELLEIRGLVGHMISVDDGDHYCDLGREESVEDLLTRFATDEIEATQPG